MALKVHSAPRRRPSRPGSPEGEGAGFRAGMLPPILTVLKRDESAPITIPGKDASRLGRPSKYQVLPGFMGDLWLCPCRLWKQRCLCFVRVA